ncbi:hypothetical protein EX895_006572 [Sporisorium graminicola]|uniref:Uncharacterized protein n=1 Tax=Sporisorium graminicola TaxID=280036 RepID=A0A4U7KKP0_9BASI|nr:hypothetical protein EX895_006572 [Sporisorium graminicola]TKY84670.1 hypothetical protein EX895_006572 [Sporisorium graminicola]
MPPQQQTLPHDPLASSLLHVQHRSVGTTRSGGALTFPPLYLDPPDHDPASNQHTAANNATAQQPGSFVLGSTFYHHPELNALVSNHLIDASANALDAASGTGHAFLASIFASRDGAAHDDDSDAEGGDGAAGGGGGAGGVGADSAVAVPRPKITSEFVSLNEDLVPASLDMHGDMLPADQHPSYPFGNLFGPLGGMIAADSAIVGGAHGNTATNTGTSLGGELGDAAATLGLDFGGGLDGFINLGHSSHGRRSAVSNAWNNSINKASRSKLVGSASANAEWNIDALHNTSTNPAATAVTSAASASAAKDDHARPSHRDIVLSAKKLDLSPSLLFRTNTSTVLAPPTWPFRRHGPGSTSYAALLRPSSNIFGNSPASQAVAATLGGLPASSKILREVWSDLALEELVPTHIGDTSAVRHLDEQDETDDTDAGAGDGKRGRKRAREAESDLTFAKRIATLEADPLDLLGPISREIRGQAAQPWGTATARNPHGRPRRRHRSTYSNQSEDEAAEAEHDDAEHGFAVRDRLRYSFALPPANFSWVESPEDGEASHDADERAGTMHVEPDGIGWSTAKRIFVNEERDRLLAPVASRAAGGAAAGVEAYQVRGLRANQGLLPRPRWTWADGALEDVDTADASYATLSASGSHQSLPNTHPPDEQHSVVNSDEEVYEEEEEEGDEGWDQGAEDQELQRALLLQYQREIDGEVEEVEDGGEAEAEEEEEDEEAQVEYDLDAQYSDNDEDVESFSDADTA